METATNARSFALDEVLFTIPEAAMHLRISRTGLYRLIGAKELRPVKIGSRTLIQGAELQRYMKALSTTAL